MDPTIHLDQLLAEGTVAEKVFVERFESEAQHSQEALDEDDAFLGSAAPEVWEYEVVDGRVEDFVNAVENADTVMEYDLVDDSVTDATELPMGSELASQAEAIAAEDVAGADGGEGPAGQPTVDPSAGGLSGGGHQKVELEDEGMSVSDASDPRLGLTNIGEVPAEDWAADTGPSKTP